MSIGEIGGIIGPCEECRHTHGSSSCATCGGGTGFMGPPTIPPCRACLDGIALTPQVPTMPDEIGPDDDTILILEDDSTTVSQPAELVTMPEVLDIPPGKVLPLPQGYAVTQLPPTWRSLLTDCAVLLKAIAEKDEAAATEHVRQFNELLTRAAQYGS